MNNSYYLIKSLAVLFTFALSMSHFLFSQEGVLPETFNSKSSVSFTENKGQISDQNYLPRPDVLFSGEAGGLVYHLREDGISYQLSRVDKWKDADEATQISGFENRKWPDLITVYRTDINWIGTNKNMKIVKGESHSDYNNYYLAVCPEGVTNVKSYERVTYKNIYDGIDLKLYDNNGELEYDFIVSPGIDYKSIKWKVEGATSIHVDENGDLIIETPMGMINERAPKAYQDNENVSASWISVGNQISFKIDAYDHSKPLVIDPLVRHWATYYGDTASEIGYSTVSDGSNIYMSGDARSINLIATNGAHQTSLGGGLVDAFLVKFDAGGQRLWGTYYGGNGGDYGRSCASNGTDVYLTGFTYSNNAIATTGAHKASNGTGYADAFLVKFNSNGARQWGTFYGGSVTDYGYSCASDGSNVYITGCTTSSNAIASSSAHQSIYGGGNFDAFLVKFNSSGQRLWGTFLGGSLEEFGFSCSSNGTNIYVAGQTRSTNAISTSGAHQTLYAGGTTEAFLVKFNGSGVRQWGTYYGGPRGDVAFSCFSNSNDVYLAGGSSSYNAIATSGAHQTALGGIEDAFLVKFNSNGMRQWGTYYGGSNNDIAWSCSNEGAKVYLIGQTSSVNSIATSGSVQDSLGGGNDAFLVTFDTSGVRLAGTYYGGSGNEIAKSCSSIGSYIYLVGETSSTNSIATSGAHQTMYGGGINDAFIVKLAYCEADQVIDSLSACDSLVWIDGIKYTSSNNTATYTLTKTAGCDSVVTLNLTIDTVDTEVSRSNNIFSAQASNAVYQWFDCATNSPLTGDTNSTFVATMNGSFAVAITLNNCTDTSDCFEVTGVGIEDRLMTYNISLFPNPTSNKVNIDLGSLQETIKINLLNDRSQLLEAWSFKNEELVEISINHPSGMYIIEIVLHGEKSYHRVLKE